jgi:hypothetical protein
MQHRSRLSSSFPPFCTAPHKGNEGLSLRLSSVGSARSPVGPKGRPRRRRVELVAWPPGSGSWRLPPAKRVRLCRAPSAADPDRFGGRVNLPRLAGALLAKRNERSVRRSPRARSWINSSRRAKPPQMEVSVDSRLGESAHIDTNKAFKLVLQGSLRLNSRRKVAAVQSQRKPHRVPWLAEMFLLSASAVPTTPFVSDKPYFVGCRVAGRNERRDIAAGRNLMQSRASQSEQG